MSDAIVQESQSGGVLPEITDESTMEQGNKAIFLLTRAVKAATFLLVAAFFVALGTVGSTYLWYAKQLHYSWQLELGEARAKGRITEEEYIARSQERSYMKALMSPSKVWKTD